MSGDTENQIDLSGDKGVLKKILTEGTGTETPSTGCTVSLHYTGTLTDGTKFDSSVDRNEPFEFKLGTGSVIKAFDMGVATMKLGEKCVLTCASDYAYGAAGSPPNIPPNATLLFELEMLGWRGEDISEQKDGGIEKLILTKGTKKKSPVDGLNVKIHLTGSYEGKVFEDRDAVFDLGEGSEIGIVIGVETAIQSMHQGEVAKFIIKPKYAFGAEGKSEFNIPANATVEYVITLNEFEKEPETWKWEDEERLAQSNIYKEKGTKYFKLEKYTLALKFYTKALEIIENCNDYSAQKVPLHLNTALCHMKTNDYMAAVKSCNSVIELDANNIKAYFRRGQSWLATAQYEDAIVDFEKVKSLEPENKAAANQIIICRQKIKEFEEKEKKIYANMFAKFSKIDKQREATEHEKFLEEHREHLSYDEWKESDTDNEKSKQQATNRILNENVVMLNNV